MLRAHITLSSNRFTGARTHTCMHTIIPLMQSSERSKTVVLEIHTIQKEKKSKVTTKERITSARRYRVYDVEGTREGFWDAQRV